MSYGPTLPPGVKATLVVFIALGIVLANAFVVLAIVRASRTPSLRGFAKVLAMLLVCENIISLLLIVLLAFSVTDKWPYGNTFCHRTLLNSVACSLASLSAVIYVAIHPISFQHNLELNLCLAFIATVGVLPLFHITDFALVLICN